MRTLLLAFIAIMGLEAQAAPASLEDLVNTAREAETELRQSYGELVNIQQRMASAETGSPYRLMDLDTALKQAQAQTSASEQRYLDATLKALNAHDEALRRPMAPPQLTPGQETLHRITDGLLQPITIMGILFMYSDRGPVDASHAFALSAMAATAVYTIARDSRAKNPTNNFAVFQKSLQAAFVTFGLVGPFINASHTLSMLPALLILFTKYMNWMVTGTPQAEKPAITVSKEAYQWFFETRAYGSAPAALEALRQDACGDILVARVRAAAVEENQGAHEAIEEENIPAARQRRGK